MSEEELLLTMSTGTGRKVSDRDFGSFDKSYHMTYRVPMKSLKQEDFAEFDELLDKVDDWLEDRIQHRMLEWMEKDILVQETDKTPENGSKGTFDVPESGQAPLEDAVRMEVTELRVKNHPDKDMKIVFALGLGPTSTAYKGKWNTHGVVAYPETYLSFFDPEKYGLGDHAPGARLYADVYLKEDGKTPDKIKQFVNSKNEAYPLVETEEG